jgi:phenylacetate-CoA ligase
MNIRKYTIAALLKITGSHIYDRFSEIEKISHFSKDKLAKYQEKKLRELLIHAYKHSPYYHELLKTYAVVNHNDVNLKNFKKLPFLTKEVIRKNQKALVSDDWLKRKPYLNTSGGSTGQPVKLVQDKSYQESNIANKLFYASLVGKQMGEKELKFWGSERDIFTGSIGLTEKLKNFVYNRQFLNAFRMTPENMKEYTSAINVYKPKHIWTYVDSIFELAKFIERKNLSVHPPKSIIATAGVLTKPVRSFVERVFKTSVYNQYGSREVGDMAAECKYQQGLHLFEWSHYVEVIKGKVIVTVLTNYAMPLIRYEIGDMAALANAKKCRCGLSTRKLMRITGRSTDHFIKKDGTVVHGEYFTHLFYFKDWVQKFRVIQRTYSDIICEVVVNKKPDTVDVQHITRDIKHIMGNSCKVTFKYVKKIQPTGSGKYLYTFSKVTKK